MADLFDLVAMHDWHFISANADEKKAKPKAPKKYPRWWLPPRGAKSAERVAKIEAARRRKHAREKAIAEGRIA